MKKILFIITLFSTFFFGYINVGAASISLTPSSKNVVAGNNFTVTISISEDAAAWDYSIGYDTNKLRVVSSNLENSLHSASVAQLHSRSYSLTFKALQSGNANIYVSDAALYSDSESSLSVSKGSTTISVKTQSEIEASYSKNNDLSSLSIDGVEISPSFDKDTVEYSVLVPPDTTSVNVNATVADSKATLTGVGNREVTEGDNNIEVVVTAENGSVKTYSIKVTVEEFDPLKVKIKGKDYTVVRKKSMLGELNNYTDTTIKINDVEVPALKSDITGYTLIALKDEKGNQNYYIVEKDTYKLYKEYTFSKIVLCPLEFKKSDILKNYKKYTITYNDEKVEAYKISKNSKYALIYAMNVETGEKHIYMYDSKEDTVQIYNEEEINLVKKENGLYLKIALGFGILSGVLTIFIIGIMIHNHKKNKKR